VKLEKKKIEQMLKMNDFRYYNYDDIDSVSEKMDGPDLRHKERNMPYKHLIGNNSSVMAEPKTYFTQYLDTKGKEDKTEKKMAEFLKKR
jgi:hypothetical protein